MKVVKRDGKKCEFNSEKIAIAIRKGFNGAITQTIYTEEDHNKVFLAVTYDIEKNYEPNSEIPIEDIQDLIEKKLKEFGYIDVYEAFSSYRNRRNESRRAFEGRQHKLMKSIETLSLKTAKEEDAKREKDNRDGKT